MSGLASLTHRRRGVLCRVLYSPRPTRSESRRVSFFWVCSLPGLSCNYLGIGVEVKPTHLRRIVLKINFRRLEKKSPEGIKAYN